MKAPSNLIPKFTNNRLFISSRNSLVGISFIIFSIFIEFIMWPSSHNSVEIFSPHSKQKISSLTNLKLALLQLLQ